MRIKFNALKNNQEIHPALYDEVYNGDVDCENLEEVFTLFNVNHPLFHRGHSLSVSDVVQVIEAPELVGRIKFFDDSGNVELEVDYVDSKEYNSVIADAHESGQEIIAVRLKDHHVPSVEPGCYYCDRVGFEKIDFNPEQTRKPDNLLRVVAKEPDKPAYEAEVANNFRAFQQAVRGYFETFPLDKKTVIICNEEGKIKGMEANCVINNQLLAGTIFVIGRGRNGNFCSLSEKQTNEYLEMFRQAEILQEQDGGIQMF